MSKALQKLIIQEFNKTPQQRRATVVRAIMAKNNNITEGQIAGSFNELTRKEILSTDGKGNYKLLNEEEIVVSPVKKTLKDTSDYLRNFVYNLNQFTLVEKDLITIRKIDTVIKEITELNDML
jgi:hypothetical protein